MVVKSSVIIAMEKTANRVAETLLQHFGSSRTLQVSKKGPGNFVTNADISSEQIIIEELQKLDGSYGILTEERGYLEGENNSYCWIADPLDGTTNYIHGVPHYCVSLALQAGCSTDQPEIVAALVLAPTLGQVFWAETGAGAFLNDKQITVSDQGELSDALLAGYVSRNPQNAHIDVAARSALAANVRIMGSAALELAYVAAGILDGFWHANLNAWDIAAGILLVREAGGKVSEITGGADMLVQKNILATNGHLHQRISAVISPFYR